MDNKKEKEVWTTALDPDAMIVMISNGKTGKVIKIDAAAHYVNCRVALLRDAFGGRKASYRAERDARAIERLLPKNVITELRLLAGFETLKKECINQSTGRDNVALLYFGG